MNENNLLIKITWEISHELDAFIDATRLFRNSSFDNKTISMQRKLSILKKEILHSLKNIWLSENPNLNLDDFNIWIASKLKDKNEKKSSINRLNDSEISCIKYSWIKLNRGLSSDDFDFWLSKNISYLIDSKKENNTYFVEKINFGIGMESNYIKYFNY